MNLPVFVREKSRLGRRAAEEGRLLSESNIEYVYELDGQTVVVIPGAPREYPAHVKGEELARYLWYMVFFFILIVVFFLGAVLL